jgi:hypothetical protein
MKKASLIIVVALAALVATVVLVVVLVGYGKNGDVDFSNTETITFYDLTAKIPKAFAIDNENSSNDMKFYGYADDEKYNNCMLYFAVSDYPASSMREAIEEGFYGKSDWTYDEKNINGDKWAVGHREESAKFNQTYYVAEKNGKEYTVSPYALIIDNGNYYLLGVEETTKKARTFRADRMREVKITNDFISSLEEYEDVDVTQYTQGHFGMFHGEKQRVTMSFTIRMLDAVIERFGRHDVVYQKSGKGFFTATATVYVSNQFFGWMCGFGKQAKIVAPLSVKGEFAKYVSEIYEANK